MFKYLTFCVLVSLSANVFAQTSAYSINAGAQSGNISYSIGDIFVVPSSSTSGGSGTLGAVASIRGQLVAVENADATAAQVYFYPNPVQNLLNLGIKGAPNTLLTVNIFDLNGRNIYTQKTSDGQIDLQNLTSGAYIVELQDANDKVAFKIVKN